jgi:uncharacterized membrane protein YtjA (UPF0391 family)
LEPFWPIFGSLIGVNIRTLILTPIKKPETRLKRAQKATEAALLNTLLEGIRKHLKIRGCLMLMWALIFFIVAIIAGLFGFKGIEGAATSIAKIFFFIFLILFIVSVVFGLVNRA